MDTLVLIILILIALILFNNYYLRENYDVELPPRYFDCVPGVDCVPCKISHGSSKEDAESYCNDPCSFYGPYDRCFPRRPDCVQCKMCLLNLSKEDAILNCKIPPIRGSLG